MGGEGAVAGDWLRYLLPLAVFAIIFAFRWRRMSQERPLNLRTLWIVPALLVLVLAAVLATTPPRGIGWAWVAAGLVAGGAIGWWRGTTTRIAVDPATGRLNHRASPLAFVILLLLVVFRQAARYESAAFHADVATVTNALLALGVAAIAVMRVEMSVRARRLLARAAGSSVR